MAAKNMIKVLRQEPVFVVPSKPTKSEMKELSDIDDQDMVRVQIPTILCYTGDHSHLDDFNVNPAKVIKEALAEALVYYYPFAGRVREGPNRKLIVDCNGKGVLFVEADADVTLKEVEAQILPPCPLLEELLFAVPGSIGIIGCPLLLFQVTRFKCGGFILGVRFNHTMCDYQGLGELLNTMSEVSKGAKVPSIVPVWQRELLRARCPPTVTCTHREYDVEDKNYKQSEEDAYKVVGSFYFGPKEIKAIRSHLPAHLRRSYSTYNLLCACIWRCRTLALQLDPEETVRLSYVMNVRHIMSLPLGYYGNVIAQPIASIKVKQFFCKDWLVYTLELVKEVRASMNDEYVRSVMDFMVVKGRPDQRRFMTWIPTNYSRGLENVDFGWGAPMYCGTLRTIHVMSQFTRIRNGEGEDVIIVPLNLPIEVMLRFQKELARVVNGVAFHNLDVLQPVYLRSML